MNTKSFAMAGSLLAACALFGSLTGCTPEDPGTTKPGTDPDEPEKLENQIKLDDELTDIKTVLYEKDGEEWTFWLSPREDVVLVTDMEKVDDYLKVTAKFPKGTVDVTAEEFSIKYKNVTVNGKTMKDFSVVELQADALENDGKVMLNLYVLVENKAGSRLTARYNGAVSEGIGEVAENTWRFDTEVPEPILSVVRTLSLESDYLNNAYLSMFTDYYLYNEEGRTAPADENETAGYIKVSIARDLAGGTRHDLATVDRSKLKIVCGDFDLLAANPTGTFIFNARNGFSMEIDAAVEKDGRTSYFKANCSYPDKDVQRAYESDNVFTFVGDRNTAATSTREVELKKVFHDKKNTGGYVLAFGLKEDPAAQADLKDPESRYAVEVRLNPADVQNGNVVDLVEDKNKAEVIIYDYEEYSTLKFSEVTSGDGLQYNIGAMYAERSGDNVFFYMDVYFGPGNPGLKLTWNGPVTEVEEWTDLTPERPAAPNFIGKAPEGTDPATGSLYKKITGMTVSEATSMQGVSMELYNFTFTCEDDSKFVLSIQKSDVGQGPIDLTSRKQESPIDGKWLAEHFLFKLELKDMSTYWGNWNFISYGQITNTWNYGAGPEKGTIDVKTLGDNIWKISFQMKNSNMNWGMPSGDGEIVTISYEGPATE